MLKVLTPFVNEARLMSIAAQKERKEIDKAIANYRKKQGLKLTDKQKKLIAAICHGPWILISAGIVKGRKMTAYWSIEADVLNAGADYQHKTPVVIDGNLITSPHYDNNGDFMKAVIEYF